MRSLAIVKATLTNENQFTTDKIDEVQAESGLRGVSLKGGFNLSISGTWVGRLTLQRSFDKGVTWKDINYYTTNSENWDIEPEYGILYRIGFKTGDYTSGDAEVRLSR